MIKLVDYGVDSYLLYMSAYDHLDLRYRLANLLTMVKMIFLYIGVYDHLDLRSRWLNLLTLVHMIIYYMIIYYADHYDSIFYR